MKKVITTLVCLLIMGSIMAQDEHLSFKGVPINGTVRKYTAAMKRKGFRSEGTKSKETAFLTGEFAGYSNCIVKVSTAKKRNVVNQIAVLMPDKDNWHALIEDYENLKSLLIDKYGAPAHVVEKYGNYKGDDNESKMHALHDRVIEWYTVFNTNLGDIKLELVSGTFKSKGRVQMTYKDAANSQTLKQKALNDL